MKPIITDINEARSKGMLRDGRYFLRTDTGQPMYLPIWYGHRLDLANMTVTENREEIAIRTDLPDLNQLIKEGKVRNATIYREHDIFLPEFKGSYEAPPFTGEVVRKVIAEFAGHGFKVTRQALVHNFKAWYSDLKSGYRDDRNGYHLFTPCGCNPLSFRATSLEPELDWQKTYEC
jgi:hypothetical protein